VKTVELVGCPPVDGHRLTNVPDHIRVVSKFVNGKDLYFDKTDRKAPDGAEIFELRKKEKK
jgi:hypothetical protein